MSKVTNSSPSKPSGLSYDRKPIRKGMTVYQVGNDQDGMPLVQSYEVLDIADSGNVSVQYWQTQNGYSNRFEEFIPSNKLHTNIKELIKMHLENDNKVLERLPKRIERWQKLYNEFSS